MGRAGAVTALSIALACALGWLLARSALPRCSYRWPLSLAVGAGFGTAVASLSYFLWLHLWPGRAPWPLELALLGVLACVAWIRRDSAARLPGSADGAGGWPGVLLAVAAGLIFAAVAVLSALGLARALEAQPHGTGDAWMIWNLRARALARAPAEAWTDAFVAGHGDYPLLLPGFVARTWTLLGGQPPAVPIAAAVLFTAATVVTLAAAVAALRGALQGLLAGLVLLGTVAFVGLGGTQVADVPLGFFVLVTCVMLLFAGRSPPGRARPPLLLGGFSAGCAAWTKNEGLTFVALLLASALLLAARRDGWRGCRRCWPLLAGSAVPLLAVVVFKSCYAPAGDVSRWFTSPDIADRLTDPSRYGTILASWGRGLLGLGAQGPLWAAVGVALLGWRPRRDDRRALAWIALLLGLQAVTYFAIYVLTPHELEWHLNTSLGRLLMHLWPSAILVAFAGARSPAELLE